MEAISEPKTNEFGPEDVGEWVLIDSKVHETTDLRTDIPLKVVESALPRSKFLLFKVSM